MKYQVLTDQDVQHFLEHGYIVIREAFPPEVAREWTEYCFERLGLDLNDPTTWNVERRHMSGTYTVDVREFSPRCYGAICDLLGGEERVRQPVQWSDAFIVNLSYGADRPYSGPSPDSEGWHKDGDFFRHFLDSPEQGLLVFVNWTDVLFQGGATFIAEDSVGVVARYLAAHPEGVMPGELPTRDLVRQCSVFKEMTAQAGDVALLHPYMLHAASQNVLRSNRIITNPPIALREPMELDRTNPEEFSPVELAVLRGLGVERYDFTATGERERFTPASQKVRDASAETERSVTPPPATRA